MEAIETAVVRRAFVRGMSVQSCNQVTRFADRRSSSKIAGDRMLCFLKRFKLGPNTAGATPERKMHDAAAANKMQTTPWRLREATFFSASSKRPEKRQHSRIEINHGRAHGTSGSQSYTEAQRLCPFDSPGQSSRVKRDYRRRSEARSTSFVETD